MSQSERRTRAIARAERAFELRVAGRTQQEIATELGVSRQAVAKMIEKAEAAAVERMQDRAARVKARELAQLDHIKSEALRAWDRSKRRRVSERVKSTSDGDERTVTREAQAGNPKFLAVVIEAMEREARLLGIDAPARAEVAVTRPFEQMTDGELLAELDKIKADIEESARIH